MEDELGPASQEFIARLWQEEWGLPNVSVRRQYMPTDVEGLAWRAADGNDIGLVTWAVDGDRAEIVSRLMDAAEEELRRRGVKTVHLVTTNDNHRALSFYVRRGYRLVRLHLDAMDRVRQAKPQVPLIGDDGIPLLEMWELERDL